MSYGFFRKISDGPICIWDLKMSSKMITYDGSADRTYGKMSSHLIGSDQRENIPSYNP